MKKAFIVVALVLLTGAYVFFAAEAFPQTAQGAPQETTQSAGPSEIGTGTVDSVGRVLFVFLVLSVVFEVALTPIFNWRVFMAHFEERGLKTPITVALAFVVFWSYDLDIISDLLTALGKPTGRSLGGQILTALLIAGGSSGVFQVFTRLGIRMNTDDRKKKAEEAKQKILEKREGLQDKEKQ